MIEQKIDFNELYQKCIDNIQRYNDFAFIPVSPIEPKIEVEDEKFFNEFSGFKATFLNDWDGDLTIIEPILHHIKVVLANNIEESYEYLLTHWSSILKDPKQKTKVMLILFSLEQQIGKGIIIEWFLNEVIGLANSCKTATMKHLLGNFNGMTENKLLMVIDEVNNDEKYSDRETEKLKSLITDDIQTIEKKGIDAKQVRDCCNYICLTNNSNAIKISEGDRRVAVFRCNPIYAGNFDYFSKLQQTLLRKDSADIFLTYLCKRTNKINLRNIPKSNEREEMIFQTAEQPIKYFRCIEDGSYMPRFQRTSKDGFEWSQASHIYEDFKNWITLFDEKQGIYSLIKFSKFLKNKCGDKKAIRLLSSNYFYNVSSLVKKN
jgi:hypothetical protein